MNLGFGGFSLADQEVEEFEAAVSGGAWFSPAGRVQPLLGVRIGVGALHQQPRWAPAGGWHSIDQPTLSPARLATVPLLAEAGLLVRVGLLGIRAGVQGGVLVVEDGGGAIVAPSVAGTLGLVIAP